MPDTRESREKFLRKLTKRELATRHMHPRGGGLLKLAEYMTWTNRELIDAVLEDEGFGSESQSVEGPRERFHFPPSEPYAGR